MNILLNGVKIESISPVIMVNGGVITYNLFRGDGIA